KRSPDYSIIFVDLPGFGEAPVQTNWTLSDEMKDLHAKLSFYTNIVIGGLSMGGYAAFAYYRLFPKVRGLILSNTKAAADSEEAKKGRDAFAADARKRGADAVYEKLLPKLISDFSRERNPALEPALKKTIASFSPEAIAEGLLALKV